MAEKSLMQRLGFGDLDAMPPELKQELLGDVNNAMTILPMLGIDTKYLPANWPIEKMGQKLMAILKGLQRGTAFAGVSPQEQAVDPFFSLPVGPSISTILNQQGKPQQVEHYATPTYPPAGVDPTEWAMAHPPAPEQALPSLPADSNYQSPGMRNYGTDVPTPEDLQRWSSVLNETVVPKATPSLPTKKPASPKAKAKPKDEWNTIITGLGPYAPKP